MTQPGFFTKLQNRGRIKIAGPDSGTFLQGLITADINALTDDRPLLYSCLLTSNGKFLHDFFVSGKDGQFTLDCEGNERAENLAKTLSIYKLRAQVEISCEPEVPVFALINHNVSSAHPDPRNPKMGGRAFNKPEGCSEGSFEDWDRHRISLFIPDGSRDMTPETSTLLEFGIDSLNGVSFDKGCYLGQELTARMHYRGLVKKHVCLIQGESMPPPGAPLFSASHKNIGEMLSSCTNIGLCLIKKEYMETDVFTDPESAPLKIRRQC